MAMRSGLVCGLIGAALGVGATLLVSGGESASSDGPRRSAERATEEFSAAEARSRISRLDEQVVTLQRELKQARETAEVAKRQAAAAATPPSAAENKPTDTARKKPRFVYREQLDALSAADWATAGTATAQLMPLLGEAAQIALGKKPMRAELFTEITGNVGPLVTEAIRLEEAGARWNSPAVALNLVHATLRESGQPLSEEQEQALDQIGARFVTTEEQRLAGYNDETLALRKRLDSARQLESLYAEVRPVLNDAQRAVLYPTGVRGVIGLDVFAGSSQFDEHYGQVRHRGRENLRAITTEQILGGLSMREALAPQVRTLVANWEQALPDEFVLAKPSPAQQSSNDMELSARLLFAAERQLALQEALLRDVALNEEERKRVRELDHVSVPLYLG